MRETQITIAIVNNPQKTINKEDRAMLFQLTYKMAIVHNKSKCNKPAMALIQLTHDQEELTNKVTWNTKVKQVIKNKANQDKEMLRHNLTLVAWIKTRAEEVTQIKNKEA